ncbi:helix-turn-helix domain-containing protein [Staphylococcus aureus]|uniref:helix-turn-helix domain-containing protein n=1 Tax=Staphylococcus aureus TaxID=1280 RepID=UPI0014431C87|nr:helix-turn-helix domain-containing protein [Staphylococcus aureus]NKP84503.1 helix-turn-helix domain-containing protein [Staphylococcus aureus]
MRTSKEIGQQIKQKRRDNHINLTDFAKRIGVNKSTLSRYENGSRKVPMEDINTIAHELNITPEQLIFKRADKTGHMDDYEGKLTEEEWQKIISYAEDIIKQRKEKNYLQKL